MTEAWHTPGLWTESWDFKMLARDTGRVISHACGPQHSCKGIPIDDGSDHLMPDRETMEKVFADARLIAAAPIMLEALMKIETAYDLANWQDRVAENMKFVREAIAKATGATP